VCRPSSGCLENLSDYTLRVVPFCGGGRDLALHYWPHTTGMPHLKILHWYCVHVAVRKCEVLWIGIKEGICSSLKVSLPVYSLSFCVCIGTGSWWPVCSKRWLDLCGSQQSDCGWMVVGICS